MSWAGGDWMCPACQHINFKKREACQHCSYPKYGGPDPTTFTYRRPGDWYCTAMNCGSHNYASRSSCYRCGAMKNDYGSGYGGDSMYGSDGSAPPGWKTGDWICSRMGCGEHNYASRTECYKCKTPRDYGGV
ncbi:hypothetical protein P3X46_031538 [Hevea brasiliensis]|uniref:RanBP2-type domain-containing protein n=1 Tax=Hevea brasiliensis TaxID=3981 RepID=A0ABQ9KKN0_HEVBR|nr:RNA-binding protein involved in heterochromatin assembly dri1 [Hevea brasiliensis]XP_021667708.1 RNA-binding protein involved in heterochromatin assembly dri1 [Hevea brasiliensis]KAJ9140949.1 hypothetical protein P3X46_031538 [Hevea brasiliensis]